MRITVFETINLISLGVIYLFAGYVLAIHLYTEVQWVPVLDSANLAFHEAGHLIIGLLNDRLNVYGGTLLQLLLPTIIFFKFICLDHVVGIAISAIWLVENLLNVARYLGDARSQMLPLVGGGHHDWAEILSRWNLLELDGVIAHHLKVIAIFLTGLICIWSLIRYFRTI